MTLTRRYPGSRPFEDCPIERLLFRGRDREKADLVQLILAHDLVLLYARSGTGKTSLINAGVLEELRRREYFPAVVRLTNSETPMETMRETVLHTAQNLGLQVEDVDATPSNLVLLLSKGKFWRGDILLTPVIILDQFEELFTLHEPPAQAKIIEALSDLAARRLPSEFDERFGQFPTMPYKIIFSVREDYLGEMETVASRIPTVMHHRFRLTPLSREQARQAITEPAKMKNEELQGPVFGYTDEAIEELLSFLARRRERDGYRQGSEVEPFQLQIICYHIESTVVKRASKGFADVGVVINVGDLGGTEGMDQILEQFYNCQIDQFPEELRERIHDLFENGFISATGKRISLEEDNIGERFDIDHNTLVRLVNLRLLRAEPRVGSTYYELTHDSLVSAVKRTGTVRKPKVLLEEARTGATVGTPGWPSTATSTYWSVHPKIRPRTSSWHHCS